VVPAPRPSMRVVRNASTGEVDYLGIPGQPMRATALDHGIAAAPEAPGDYLDIPAFLRRQAD
jgi:cell division protein FtsZ